MTLHQLRIFLAVSDASSFAIGAQKLHLAQPTVSQHIGALEDEVGMALFIRSRRGAVLTEAGKELRTHARKIMRSMSEAEKAIGRFKVTKAPPLRVGTSSIPGAYILPRLFPALFKSHPNLRLALVQGDSRETIDRVIADEVELGLVGSCFEHKGLAYEPIGKDLVRLVVVPGHPWAGKGEIAPVELPDKPIFVRESGSGTGRAVEAALRRAGVEPTMLDIRAELGSTESQKAAVMSGEGAAFLSELAIGEEVKRGDLVTVEIKGLAIDRSFHLVRRARGDESEHASIFRHLVTSFQVG